MLNMLNEITVTLGGLQLIGIVCIIAVAVCLCVGAICATTSYITCCSRERKKQDKNDKKDMEIAKLLLVLTGVESGKSTTKNITYSVNMPKGDNTNEPSWSMTIAKK